MAQDKQAEAPNPAGGSSSAALQGQITAPNPLEIFWEKYKVWIIVACLVLAGLIASTYIRQYLETSRRNSTWNAFAEKVEFRKTTVLESSGMSPMMLGYFLPADFDKFLQDQTVEELKAAATDLAGTKAEPWAIWALASREAREGRVQETEAEIARLRSSYPDFPGLHPQAAPPVYRPEPEKDEESDEEPERPATPEAKSPADLLLAMAKRNSEMRSTHPELYTAPEPTSTETVVFKTSEGEFSVRLYAKRAPKSTEQFLKNVREKKYDGLRFHRIERRPSTDSGMFPVPELVFFGNPKTSEESKSEWNSYTPEERIAFEESGISHFPWMLAWKRDDGEKDNDPLVFYITGNDAGQQRDGDYTIFGRVVSGEDIVKRILEGELSSETEEQAGKGTPRRPVQVTEAVIQG